jgi:hypothetical protein
MTNGAMTDRVCQQAVALMHAAARLSGAVADDVTAELRRDIQAEIRGLRRAVCVLKGLDANRHCGIGGHADNFLKVWHRLPGHCTEPGCRLR